MLISRRVLELLLRNGARSAEPGEFTQRAYLHGKMDLTQAEAVMDLIGAQTDLALRAATEQLEGRLGELLRELRDRLIEVLAHIEAFIDFPDEDIDPATGGALLAKIDAVRTGASAPCANRSSNSSRTSRPTSTSPTKISTPIPARPCASDWMAWAPRSTHYSPPRVGGESCAKACAP